MAKSKSFGSYLVILILLAAAGAGAWYYTRQNKDQPPEYVTAAVARGDVIQAVTATGTLQPVVTVDVGSQISGIIDKVLVDYNSEVKKGDLVAHIDAGTYESRLRSSEAELANARANQKLVQLNADRTDTLQKNGLVPQSDLDQALAQVAQAEAQVQTRNAAVESARIDLSRCTIYSPIDGIVLSRQVDVGKTVAASFNTPVLFTIANDLTKMRIIGAIAEADVGNVNVGQSVNFTVDAFPNRQFRGRVSLIRNSPITVQNVVTYETIIDVNNDDQKLRPGMTANVSVVVAQKLGTLKISNNALRVRLPDVAPPAPAKGAPAAAGTTALRPATDEERRTLMRDAGFVAGSGPPSQEVRDAMRKLAAERGLELPARGGGGGQGGDRPRTSDTPVNRIIYRLVGKGETARPEAVNVKLGISDGTQTEVIDGLTEGDLVITNVFTSGKGAPAAPTNSPFGGQRRF
ncbi:MAG: efflux RND transporter periplasmic adaptor subunit [Opitutus sp.]